MVADHDEPPFRLENSFMLRPPVLVDDRNKREIEAGLRIMTF
jgi:hypothetical protein